jgi:GH25 family lysozyme M1 (1,4-beta-N-acetylmuramidase)
LFNRARISLAAVSLCLVVLAQADAVVPAGKRVRGIDVSRFQGRINWERVADSRAEFAFVQASRGSGSDCAVVRNRCGADEFYARNYLGATDAGIRVGAYHRAFPGGHGRRKTKRDARAEAKVFVQRVGDLRRRDLLPALDVETPFGGLGQRALRRWVRVWLDRVRRKLGERPIIYTNSSSWRATGETTRFARAGHRLWIANFDVDKPSVPADNWNGNGWSIWQFTSSGNVRGIDGHVDKNRLRVALGKISVKDRHSSRRGRESRPRPRRPPPPS